jgi:hypothetical protein
VFAAVISIFSLLFLGAGVAFSQSYEPLPAPTTPPTPLNLANISIPDEYDVDNSVLGIYPYGEVALGSGTGDALVTWDGSSVAYPSGNRISLDDPAITQSVVGGVVLASGTAVTDNIIWIKDVTIGTGSWGDPFDLTAAPSNVTGAVFGGASQFGDVTDNIIYMEGGTVKGALFGGATSLATADAKNNVVIFEDGETSEINGGINSYASACSGAACAGEVKNNTVYIKGGEIHLYTRGGVSLAGSVTENKVYISGGDFNTTSVDGGWVTGIAGVSGFSSRSNSVEVSGSATNIKEVFGGYVSFGTSIVEDNRVLIYNNAGVGIAYGGHLGTFSDTHAGDVIGNYVTLWGSGTQVESAFAGYYQGNTVANANVGFVYGNILILGGGAEITTGGASGPAAGAKSNIGTSGTKDIYNNKVQFFGATVVDIYGAKNASAAENNTIEFLDGTNVVSNDVVASFLTAAAAAVPSMTDNKVIFSGGDNTITGDLLTTNATNVGVTYTGNTFTFEGGDNTILGNVESKNIIQFTGGFSKLGTVSSTTIETPKLLIEGGDNTFNGDVTISTAAAELSISGGKNSFAGTTDISGGTADVTITGGETTFLKAFTSSLNFNVTNGQVSFGATSDQATAANFNFNARSVLFVPKTGSDITASSGAVAFADGSTEKSLQIPQYESENIQQV